MFRQGLIMKNKTLAYLLIASAICINTACHKCVECKELNTAGGNEIIWPEVCGKKKEIDDYRKYMEGVVDPGNKVQCTERKTTLF